MEGGTTSSVVMGPRSDFEPNHEEFRTLVSVTETEIIQVLRYHRMPHHVLSIFRSNHINGRKLLPATEVGDFEGIQIERLHAKFLLELVEEMRRSGVPAQWLCVDGTNDVSADEPGALALSAETWSQAYNQFQLAQYSNNVEAVTWLEQQTIGGNDAAKAYLMLHLHLSDKDLVRAGEIHAKLQRKTLPRWLQSTDDTERMHAELIMGICCYSGLGCFVDYEKAVTWYRKSADHDHIEAQCRLGYCYSTSFRGVNEDRKQATLWYRRSADQGHADAQYRLGRCYYYGYGVPEDYKRAVSWYRMASDQSHAEAQYMLAVCYQDGEGVTKDRDQAIAWHRRSAAQGYSDAISALNKMQVSLT